MHSYIRTIGFLNYTKKEFHDFLYHQAMKMPDVIEIAMDNDGNEMVELRKEVALGMGIAMRGEYDENNQFVMDYYFPYREADNISSSSYTEIVRKSDKNCFLGVSDDLRLGVDLVFFIQDMLPLLESDQSDSQSVFFSGISLMGLATEGKILLPIIKNDSNINKTKQRALKRIDLLAAAREGDEKAFEQLTLSDMDVYSNIAKRIETEDVYSIVGSTFMPNGIETDKYAVLGDIMEVKKYVNHFSMQTMFELLLDVNEMKFHVCINEKDLFGEPEVGRRFKGNVWMQGNLCLE